MESKLIELLLQAGASGLMLVAVLFFLRHLKGNGDQHQKVIQTIVTSHENSMGANTTAVTEMSKTLTELRVDSSKNIEGCKNFRGEISKKL